jgi:hypothetical protein
MSKKVKEEDKKDENEIKLNNDIRDIRTLRQLDRVNLDYDSPRLKRAMDEVGVSNDEVQKK